MKNFQKQAIWQVWKLCKLFFAIQRLYELLLRTALDRKWFQVLKAPVKLQLSDQKLSQLNLKNLFCHSAADSGQTRM